jgi:hypothetical protein
VEAHGLLARTIALVFMVSACGSTAMPTPSGSPSTGASAIRTAAAARPTLVVATSSPVGATSSPVSSLAIDDLPGVELADVDATAVCDPDPNQASLDAGESTIPCSDGLELALRAVGAVTQDPATRVYLRRPQCAAVPCSEDELSTAEVTVWTATEAFSVRLDSHLETVPLPSVTKVAAWPLAGNGPAPEVSRPPIKGAPAELAHRDAYPFCGRAEIGSPPEVLGCFRDAVLTGRKAEMIERVFGTEGGEMLWIYRYDGDGRLARYYHDQTVGLDGRPTGTWGRSDGAMILGITPLAWDFDPWSSTQL